MSPLLARDGVKVHASRVILAARCEVFKTMLQNGMSESKSDVITLPTVASSTLIEVLNFLYYGECFRKAADVGNSFLEYDWKLVLNVLFASRFFLLERLEKMVVRRLSSDLPLENVLHSEDTLNKIAVSLSTLCAHPTLVTEGQEAMFMEAIRFRLLYILISHDLTESTLFKLSREAFCYYLSKTQIPLTDGLWQWSLEEYRKLIHLLSWCAIEVDDFGRRQCLPSSESAVRFLEDGDEVRLFGSDIYTRIAESRAKFVPDKVKKDLNDFLPLVDLTSIHPELLILIIKPLNIIDAQVLTNVIETQAIRGCRWLRNISQLGTPFNRSLYGRRLSVGLSLLWKSHKGETVSNPEVDSITTVQVERPMHPNRIFKWTVLLELNRPKGIEVEEDEYPLGGLEIGFLGRCYGESFTGAESEEWLSSSYRGWALSIEGDLKGAKFYRGYSLIEGSDEFVDTERAWDLPLGKKFQPNSRIEVEVNRVQNIIVFSYEGSSIAMSLQDVPGGLLYPAVSLQSEKFQGTITLEKGWEE
ncbi:hypothetical protein R1flu_001774 [Riccia fluitans]|uniref:BTB domain-containing protein n=1 Tax=Riccia fluitans TaxID=41844 RepID=A0ABD1Y484_9MARC